MPRRTKKGKARLSKPRVSEGLSTTAGGASNDVARRRCLGSKEGDEHTFWSTDAGNRICPACRCRLESLIGSTSVRLIVRSSGVGPPLD